MEPVSAIASLGVFVAVPLTGKLAVGPLGLPIPRIAQPALWVAVGLAAWSVPLLLSLVVGLYQPGVLGAAGWLGSAVLMVKLRGTWRVPRLTKADWGVIAGLLGASAMSAAFPDDPFIAHGDIADYASYAVYMAHHAQIAIPYPWDLGAGVPDPIFGKLGHLFATQPTMTPGFGHLFPAWLAQTWAATGYDGLIRFNIVIGFLAMLAIYGVLKRYSSRRVAAVAVLLLAFNPAEIWIVQQTLSEPLAQLFIWSGLLLLAAYLARGAPRWGLAAGVLLGAAAFVRIDAFLLVPFLLTSHAIWAVLRADRDGRVPASWKPVYAGAGPTFAAALAYFVLFSRPYLVSIGPQVAAIGVLTVVGACALAASRVARVRRSVSALVARGWVAGALLIGLAVVAIYAYFIRPILPPFATYADPLEGGAVIRTRVEDALPNLGRYLTPGVVWGAFVGWSMALVVALRRRRAAPLLPILVAALGWTAIYAWNQSSIPYQFVAVRRFIPMVIPALILFSGLAATIALRRLSRGGRRLAFWAVTALLVAVTAWIGVPTYTVPQRQGAYAALAAFAQEIPTGRQVLALGDFADSGAFWMPLYLSFDRPVTPVDTTTSAGLKEVVSRLRSASLTDPVLVLSADGFPLSPLEGEQLGQVGINGSVIDQYVVPVPTTSHLESFTLTALAASGINTTGAELVARPQWMVVLDGWYGARRTAAGYVRGTNGDGRILVPIEGRLTPDTLSVAISDGGPAGGPLRVYVNGVSVFDGTIPAGAWSSDLEIPPAAGLTDGTMATIEIFSDTYQPDPALGYPGPVGVELSGVSLESRGE